MFIDLHFLFISLEYAFDIFIVIALKMKITLSRVDTMR